MVEVYEQWTMWWDDWTDNDVLIDSDYEAFYWKSWLWWIDRFWQIWLKVMMNN